MHHDITDHARTATTTLTTTQIDIYSICDKRLLPPLFTAKKKETLVDEPRSLLKSNHD